MTEYQNTRRQPARKTEKPMTRRERRRLLRLTVSGVLLVLVVAVKLLMPDVMGQYREKILHLMGENTDFVAAFSAVGRAFSGQGGIRDTLEDAYVAVFGEKEPQEAAAPLQGTVTSGFGYRIHPISQTDLFHYGVDLDAPEGSAIHAFAQGTVAVVGQSSSLGNYVTVDHPGGFSTLYAHCRSVTASAGQTVRQGDLLAEVGQTGSATGPHLHFELHRGREYINPIYYVA